MKKSIDKGWWLAHLWVIALSVAMVALTAVINVSFSSVLALVLALCCTIIIRASLSRLARAYVAYVILGLVVAPRFAIIQDLNLNRTQFLASLWILAICLGGVVSSRTGRLSARFRTDVYGHRITPAVVIATLSLIAEYTLVVQGSFGVAGQYATGDSGGGYLGLLVQIGPASAAGAFLATLGRAKRTTVELVVASAMVALQAVALTFSGFRGAAPLYILAMVLCYLRPTVVRSRAPMGRHVVVATVLFCFVAALFLRGASVRQSAASAAGVEAPHISLTNALPIVVQRFDESTALAQADQLRGVLAVREAVSLRNQLIAIVPRFIFPSKGNVDYGNRVAIAAFRAPSNTRNSATLTTLGDAIINLGLSGGFAMVAIYVFVVDTVFRRMRRVATVRSLSVRVALVMAALNLEAPVVLNLIGIVRVTITIFVAQWLVARALTPFGSKDDASDRLCFSERLQLTGKPQPR